MAHTALVVSADRSICKVISIQVPTAAADTTIVIEQATSNIGESTEEILSTGPEGHVGSCCS